MKIRKESVIRVSIAEIAELITKESGVDVRNISPQIIGDYLVFEKLESRDEVVISDKFVKQRKSRKKRNRMKTRGWRVVGKIVTDYGQSASVYEPFVTALKDKKMDRDEQKRIVEKILRQNKNNPGEESVEYFLNNTLKYLEECE